MSLHHADGPRVSLNAESWSRDARSRPLLPRQADSRTKIGRRDTPAQPSNEHCFSSVVVSQSPTYASYDPAKSAHRGKKAALDRYMVCIGSDVATSQRCVTAQCPSARLRFRDTQDLKILRETLQAESADYSEAAGPREPR